MSGITERGYKGPLVFYKNLKYSNFGVTATTLENFEQFWNSDNDLIALGSIEVDVTFDADTREAEIEALKKQRERVRGEMARQLASINDRISKLQALPNYQEASEP